MNDDNKFYLQADIKLHEETDTLKEKASKVIELPKNTEKQPDLMYFSAIFVSSGENLNHAYFLGSELLAAKDSVVNKALDVEHSETDIIGHIYEKSFIDAEGNLLDINELASREKASLDKQDMHIAIAGIIYKTRFPNIAKEVSENKFCVSMECYYNKYDVKVGDMIFDIKEAEVLGLASVDKMLGRVAKVIKAGKEIAKGTITRVLRNICFSGCGVVKHPANLASVVIETASENLKEITNTDEIIVLNYDKLSTDNKLTSEEIGTCLNKEEARDDLLDDSVGICVNYKKSVLDKAGNIVNENWCTAYDKECTSFSRDTTDPDCLRNKDIRNIATAAAKKIIKSRAAKDKREILLSELKAALSEAVKTQSL